MTSNYSEKFHRLHRKTSVHVVINRPSRRSEVLGPTKVVLMKHSGTLSLSSRDLPECDRLWLLGRTFTVCSDDECWVIDVDQCARWGLSSPGLFSSTGKVICLQKFKIKPVHIVRKLNTRHEKHRKNLQGKI